jgi:ABC-2 type transport system permease protein
MLRIYKRFWAVNWAEQWQYRANLLMYLAYWLVRPIVYLAVWAAVAQAQPNGQLNGFTAADFAAYYLVVLLVDIVTASITIHILAFKIQDGTIANEILRPTHPVLVNTLVNNVAFKALQLFVFIPVWIVLIVLFQPTMTITLSSVLLALPALIIGFVINFLFDSLVTILAFWTTRVWSIQELFFALSGMFSGGFVPLVMLPGWMQTIAGILPFQLWISFPTLVLLNRMPMDQILWNYGLQLVWGAIFLVGFNAVWSRALKRFSAVGA